MAVATETIVDTATRLHGHMLKKHWNGRALEGPDVGVRFNARLGRFIKSYLGFSPWTDNYRYMQAQGYWIVANWLMSDLTGNHQCRDLALACSDYVLSAQQPEGYWEYPNPEWKGRIATVEGDVATLGLLESYQRTRHEPLLKGAKSWYHFAIDRMGFQGKDGLLAVNYFANLGSIMVPNNSTLTLLVFARLTELTGDDQYMSRCPGMVAWLRLAQRESGELPYGLAGNPGGTDRIHFLCYQYNAFEFMDLVQYYRITGDRAVWGIMEKLAQYLSGGITRSGAARYDCHHQKPEVSYYTAALGAALSQATALGLGDFNPESERAYARVLSQIRADGGPSFFSRGNYRWLADRRSYPRNLAMILYHLLLEVQTRAPLSEQAFLVRPR